jgi:NADH:ubiquinone oxidoreductase subunit E
MLSEGIMAKINITVCMGSSCFARGNQQNLALIEAFIKAHEIDADIDLAGTRCENKCTHGPNVIINGVEYNGVTEEKLQEILTGLL